MGSRVGDGTVTWVSVPFRPRRWAVARQGEPGSATANQGALPPCHHNITKLGRQPGNACHPSHSSLRHLRTGSPPHPLPCRRSWSRCYRCRTTWLEGGCPALAALSGLQLLRRKPARHAIGLGTGTACIDNQQNTCARSQPSDFIPNGRTLARRSHVPHSAPAFTSSFRSRQALSIFWEHCLEPPAATALLRSEQHSSIRPAVAERVGAIHRRRCTPHDAACSPPSVDISIRGRPRTPRHPLPLQSQQRTPTPHARHLMAIFR